MRYKKAKIKSVDKIRLIEWNCPHCNANNDSKFSLEPELVRDVQECWACGGDSVVNITKYQSHKSETKGE